MRNLAPLLLEPEARFNVFHGDNGQGKTNLLETIYVAGTLRSFRTQRLAELIAFGGEQAYIGARVERTGVQRVYELIQRHKTRRIRLDGKPVRPITKYFGDFNVVLFAPEDLQVPRGSPAARRRFLDRAVFNRTPRHLGDVQAYEKALKNRNVLLREISTGRRSGKQGRDLLAVFDQQLAQLGSTLTLSRLQLLDEIRSHFQMAFQSITQTGVEVDVWYTTPDDSGVNANDYARLPELWAELLADRLARNRPRDLIRGTTSIGPHRDDLQFRFGGHLAASFASQGQLRALVLAWKTAEMDLLAATYGESPILLLDDVSSELDPTRNQYLFEFLKNRQVQCFITTTHPRHVLLATDRIDYQVRGGVVTRQTP